MQRTRLDPFLSQKFRFWSFMSMVLLVFVHGYTIEPRYLQPWTLPLEALGFTSFIEYVFSNGLLRFRIPMLFAISGYLFALHDAQPHRERIRKRARTLLLPYFLWSGIHLLILYAMEMDATTRSWLVANGINQMDAQRVLLSDFHWYDILARWLVVPAPYQLWFIRVLFVYNLAYPFIARWVTGDVPRRVFFSLVFLMWLSNLNLFFFEGEGLLFFGLGVWMQKTQFDIAQAKRWMRPSVWVSVAIATAFGKTWLAFEGHAPLGDAVYPMMAMLHKLCVVSGLVVAWYGSDGLVRWCMNRAWFVWLSAFSFMIYALHAPLVAVLIDPTIALFAALPQPQLWAYVVLPLTLVAASIALGAALRRATPGVYGALTGGRGLY
jgi:fucose 4-O-acetylase-like acetyltransferase